AITLLKDALTEIRRHRRRDLDDLPALSREAWALWLVLAFRCGLPSGGDEFVNIPESFDRWRELAVHHCDAFIEYHFLLSELEKVEEEAQSSLGKKSAFDLGQQRVSYHFRGTSERVLASYEMLRLAEVTGLPHTAKHFSIFSQGLIRAVNTLADEEPWS